MNSNIFNMMGIGQLDPAIIFIILLVLIFVLLIVIMVQGSKIKKLTKKYERFMSGKNGRSMESEIMELFSDIRFLKEAQLRDSADIRALRSNLTYAFQKQGIVKYDAFSQMGGKLSFSLALLNDNNDGYIINSVHSSDGCYTYIKEIAAGQCAIQLGAEEQQALNKALMSDVHSAVLSTGSYDQNQGTVRRNKYMVDDAEDPSDEEYYD